MDVFLMVRRKKVSYFIDAKETTTVLELKKILRGITKQPIDDMKLYKDEVALQPYDDPKTLGDIGFTSSTARAQAPATVGLVYRADADSAFESLDITPLSIPPDLPEVMKPQDTTSHIQD
jgi:transcription elongation factor B subunit 2